MELSVKTDFVKRYYLLDALRGICVLGMIIYHTLFDVVAFMGVEVSATVFNIINIVRDFGACCFIALAGICIHFGRRPLRRAITLSAAGLVVSAVTYIFIPDLPVVFGILTFMGAAAFIMIPLKRLLNRLPSGICAVMSLVMFLMTFELTKHHIGVFGVEIAPLPEFLYKNYFTAFLGFPFYGFVSGDYYPLFPWIFMFFFGFFIWKVIAKNSVTERLLGIRLKAFEKIGKYSLYIYMIHQPVILGVVLLVSLIFQHI